MEEENKDTEGKDISFNTQGANLEDYIIENIYEVKLLIKKEREIAHAFNEVNKRKKEAIEKHTKILRRMAGIDHLQGKVKALSKAANDKLLKE